MDKKDKKLTLKDFFMAFCRNFGALQLINLLFMIPVIVFGGAVFAVLWFTGQVNIFVCTLLIPLLMPFVAGMTYAFKNMLFAECKHPVQDYFRGIRENLKQSVSYGLLMYIITVGLWLAFSVYSAYLQDGAWVWLPFVMSLILAIIVLFMAFHVPVMIVTLRLKLSDIYKNALIFTVAGLGGNIKTLLSIMLVFTIMFMIMLCSSGNLLVGICVAGAFMVWIVPALCGFIVVFNAYPTTKKLAIDPYKNNADISKANTASDPYEDISYEELLPYLDGESDDFVYVNGRMMRRASVRALAKKLRSRENKKGD